MRAVMASSTPLRFCSLRLWAWAAMPVVLRSQVFSLMRFLPVVLLTLFPFLITVLAFVLVGLCNNMALSEEGDGWPDALIEIFLVHFDPVSIPGLFANLDAFKNLLLVGFKCWQILWSQDIGWTMKARQFHKFTHNFCGFQTRAKCHLHILTMLANTLWIKGVRACHWQQLLPRYKFWLAISELNNSLVDSFFPRFAHSLI